MKSMRVQLLGWLLPGFVAVCTVAILGVYYSAQQAIEADLDARLSRLAGSARLALRNQTAAGTGASRGPGLRAFVAKEEFQSPGQYFELWSSTGEPERRSPNLGNADLPRAPDSMRDAMRYDGTLDNGERIRVSAMQYPQGGGNPPLAFAVALSRREGEARLYRLLIDLVIGGVACCTVLCALSALALKVAMRPLTHVGEQAAAMGAGSLHERFDSEALPLEIAPIVARLNDLMARLEKSFDRERRFSGYLAHELRTPLAAIRATSEVAAKWPEQSSPDDFHEITLATMRLQQTVDSLLLLSRVETASADVTSQPVEMRPLIEECLTLHATRAGQRDLTFDLQLDPSLIVETDPRLLRIIVTNLIANATDYAPQGTVIVIATTTSEPFLCVGNVAPDLTSEDMSHLFDRLWRKDPTRSDEAHAGLGLSIASSCAHALGLVLTADLDEGGTLQMSLRRKK